MLMSCFSQYQRAYHLPLPLSITVTISSPRAELHRKPS